MAVEFEKSSNAKAVADALMKRLGPSMNNARPGYKPPVTTKFKPILKKDQVGFKVTIKG